MNSENQGPPTQEAVPTLNVPPAAPPIAPAPYAFIIFSDKQGLDLRIFRSALLATEMHVATDISWSQIIPSLVSASLKPSEYYTSPKHWIAVQESDLTDSAVILVGLSPSKASEHKSLREVARSVPDLVRQIGDVYRTKRKRRSTDLSWKIALHLGGLPIYVVYTRPPFKEALIKQLSSSSVLDKIVPAIAAAGTAVLKTGTPLLSWDTFLTFAVALLAVVIIWFVVSSFLAFSALNKAGWSLEGWDEP
jgi:hypothetical protein